MNPDPEDPWTRIPDKADDETRPYRGSTAPLICILIGVLIFAMGMIWGLILLLSAWLNLP